MFAMQYNSLGTIVIARNIAPLFTLTLRTCLARDTPSARDDAKRAAAFAPLARTLSLGSDHGRGTEKLTLEWAVRCGNKAATAVFRAHAEARRERAED